MFKIMVVEDDNNMSKLIQTILKNHNFDVYVAYDGLEAMDVLDDSHIDLIVLDVMMPNMDGYEFTQNLREAEFEIPILMLSAKQLPEDRNKGFRLGIDDYMVKPFNEEELLLRIKALLRRAQIVSEHQLTVGDIILNYDALTVEMDGKIETLPQKEFYLLYKLLSNPNKIFTRLNLMDEIWGMGSNSLDTTVNVHITRLRKRFEKVDDFSIETIRGLGYKAVIHK